MEGVDNEDEGEQTETDMPRDRVTAGPAGAARATRSLLARPFPDAFLTTIVSSAYLAIDPIIETSKMMMKTCKTDMVGWALGGEEKQNHPRINSQKCQVKKVRS